MRQGKAREYKKKMRALLSRMPDYLSAYMTARRQKSTTEPFTTGRILTPREAPLVVASVNVGT